MTRIVTQATTWYWMSSIALHSYVLGIFGRILADEALVTKLDQDPGIKERGRARCRDQVPAHGHPND